MPKKIKLAILEDHQSVIDGYLYRLSKHPEIEVPVIATTAEAFTDLLSKNPVDVLLIDINVPVSSEDQSPYPVLHLIPRWLQIYPNLAVLVISVHKSGAIIRSVIEAGASGYICKDDNAVIQGLGAVVQTVANGGIYLSYQARQYLLKQQSNQSGLTPRQMQALTLCASYPNRTTGELAGELGVAHSTFRNLLSEVYLKLDVHNRTAAIAKARQLRIIPPQPPGEESFISG